MLGYQRTSRLSSKRKSVGRLENLEPRHLLASDVIISEVLASNDDAHKDDDGATSDYIELYNTGHTVADLTGWHLTDRLDDRTRWTFPSLTLQPGESVVVFASGNDRDDANAPLHTNFRISSGGEYLALYEPDGRTVGYEFDLPQQFTDVSYGVGQTLTERTFVESGNAARVFLPSSAAEDIAADSWTQSDFDDSSWTQRTLGLGFDEDQSDGDFGPLIDANGSIDGMRGNASSAYVRTEFQIEGDVLPTYEALQLDLNFDDGFVGYLNGSEVLRVSAPENLKWDSVATESHGGIADDIEYTDFAAGAGDFTLLGNSAASDGVLQINPPAADQNGAIWRTAPVNFGSDYTFSASMVFDVHTPGGGLADGDSDGIGGEGMTFVLQSNDNNVLGTGGKSLGLENTGSTFLAIELDSGASGAFDPDDRLGSHIGINTNTDGSIARAKINRFNGSPIFAGQPGPGSNFQYLWLDYTGETKQLNVFYSTNDTKPDEPTLSAEIDLLEHFGGTPALYAGWTATTSAASNGHDVRSFDIITGVGEIGRDPVSFNLRHHIDKLQPGKNVLSFHGLNVNAADEDFLLIPTLTAKEVAVGDEIGFFSEPTPGTINGQQTDPPAGSVTISEPSKIFSEPFTIEITADSDNATIRYTLDGTLPDESSTVYSGPIEIIEPTRIRARAFEPERSPGPSSTAGYIQAGPQVTNFEGKPFESNLPVIVIDSFGNTRVDSEATQLVPSIGVFIPTGEDGRASIFDEPDYAGRIGARIRGQSSQGWAKRQYALEFIQGDSDDSERLPGSEAKDLSASIFGLPAESDWVLNGPYTDKTQLNNYITFNLSREMGQYAPRATLVEVFVNTRHSNPERAMLDMDQDYRGTYVLLEKIKVDKNRVDITQLEPGDVSDNDITGGYIWKKDKTGAEDLNISTGIRRQEVRVVEPSCSNAERDRETRLNFCESGEISNQQLDWLRNHLTEFEAALYGSNFTDPKEGYANYIDVGSWIDTWLLVEFTKNIDGFRLSTYYHKDRGGKIKQGPAWDYNLSFGNANYLRGGHFDGWYGETISGNDYPYWDRLFEDPAFEQAVADRWNELRQSTLATEKLLADVDAAVNLLSDGNPNLDNPAEGEPSNPISRNYERWTTGGYGTDKYHWPNCYFAGNMGDCPQESPLPGGGEPQVYGDYIFLMKRFIELRSEWIDQQFAPQLDATPVAGVIPSGTQVSISGPADHEIYYTTDGSDPSQPLRNVEEHSLIGADVAASYLVPSDSTLIDQCDGRSLPEPLKCFLNPDYVQGSNGETWKDTTLGIGYGEAENYDLFIDSNIEADVKANNGSVYVRIPFEVTEEMMTNFNSLQLEVQYDDGFMAYFWRPSDSGREVARDNAPGRTSRTGMNAQVFDSVATASRRASDAIRFRSFDLTEEIENVRVGQNYLVIQALNDDANDDTFLFDARLTLSTMTEQDSPSVTKYEGPITVDENTKLFVRGFDPANEEWTRPYRGDYVVDVAEDITITEINYNPLPPTRAELTANPNLEDEDFEFVEIKNLGDSSANLLGVEFSNGLNYKFDDVDLASGDYGLIVKDRNAFELRYGTEANVIGEFGGNLDNNGETITLSAGETVLSSFLYSDNDPWSQAADGSGASLELIDDATFVELYSKPYSWRTSVDFGGSPGRNGSDPIGVVINEVLSRTEDDDVDAIELLNVTDAQIDVGGWYVSDSNANLQKYKIPAGTTINAGEMLVLDESHFNADPNDPNSFAISGTSNDDIWLTIADENGQTTTLVDSVQFRASLNGESYGRYPNGSGRLAPAASSIGATNLVPRVGPVVISEINYNPAAPSEAATNIDAEITSSDLEFVEIHNPTTTVMNLTDWQLRGGVDMNFDIDTMLAANESLVIISFNPDSEANASRTAAFRAHYGIDENTRLLGGFQGRLNGDGERVTLLSRDLSLADEPVVLPLTIQDEVIYDDRGLWPTQADGMGQTLHRRELGLYGNLAASWSAAAPSPGIVDFEGAIVGDFNTDGVVDIVDVELSCSAIHADSPDAMFDLNGDGMVDLQDQTMLVERILNTSAGDANLDGVFNSSDLVQVFTTAHYEDGIAGNSSWSTGDWNCDGDFTSSDLVVAFLSDRFVAAAVGTAGSDPYGLIAASLVHTQNERNQSEEVEDAMNDSVNRIHEAPEELMRNHLAERESLARRDRIFADRDFDLELKEIENSELLE